MALEMFIGHLRSPIMMPFERSHIITCKCPLVTVYVMRILFPSCSKILIENREIFILHMCLRTATRVTLLEFCQTFSGRKIEWRGYYVVRSSDVAFTAVARHEI